jgi:hypothetical protein
MKVNVAFLASFNPSFVRNDSCCHRLLVSDTLLIQLQMWHWCKEIEKARKKDVDFTVLVL